MERTRPLILIEAKSYEGYKKMNVWAVLMVFLIGWISTLSGVAMGGFLVYRTKRENYEGLFQAREPAGDAFTLNDNFSEAPEPIKSSATIPPPVASANDAFVQQFAETLADKGAAHG